MIFVGTLMEVEIILNKVTKAKRDEFMGMPQIENW